MTLVFHQLKNPCEVRTVGFTGSRNGITAFQRAVFGTILIFDVHPAVFRHGSCKGADVEAARVVRYAYSERGIRIIAHPGLDNDLCRVDSGVDDDVLAGRTHFARNRDIVDKSDLLVAMPDCQPLGSNGGTSYTVGYAKKVGRQTLIIWPDGTTEVRA